MNESKYKTYKYYTSNNQDTKLSLNYKEFDYNVVNEEQFSKYDVSKQNTRLRNKYSTW